jgi:hypothetical protein
MTLADLLARCRSESKDETAPYLWSDPEWTAWLNEAETEVCIRARLIEDEAIVGTITAGDSYVDLPETAFSVSRAAIVGGSSRLRLIERHNLDLCGSGRWEDETGTPDRAYRTGNKLRLVPTPVEDGSISISAFCTPSYPMVSDSDVPEIASRLHHHLVDWALRNAYRKPDVDAFDPAAADRHEAEFARVFGPRPDEVELRRTRLSSRRRTSPQFL